MIAAIVAAVVIVIVIPVVVMLSGSVLAAALGWLLRDHAETAHEGSELIDLNV